MDIEDTLTYGNNSYTNNCSEFIRLGCAVNFKNSDFIFQDGRRTFGYCRRIQPEGDELCLPLAMCILTRHSRARGLFSQVSTLWASKGGWGNRCTFPCLSKNGFGGIFWVLGALLGIILSLLAYLPNPHPENLQTISFCMCL